jgi:hypothetical protein
LTLDTLSAEGKKILREEFDTHWETKEIERCFSTSIFEELVNFLGVEDFERNTLKPAKGKP